MKKIKAVSFILFLLLIAAMIASCNKPEDLITITFETFEGSEVEPLKCNGKTVISMPAQPEKTGYEFGGWYTDPEFNNPFVYSTLLDNPVNEDITVYAKWIPIKFTVTFVAAAPPWFRERKSRLWIMENRPNLPFLSERDIPSQAGTSLLTILRKASLFRLCILPINMR